MPLLKCSVDGKQGWKWGESGTCFLSREDALAQARAIMSSATDSAPTVTSGVLYDEESGPNVNRLALDVAVLTARFEERCERLATKDDIAELRELIAEMRMTQKLSTSARGALLTAVTTALSALAAAVYSLFSS